MKGIRRGEARDLTEVAAIQAASPEAAIWNDVADYLRYDFRVYVRQGRVAGFLVSRVVADGECEVLNLAVALEFRRHGVARRLIESLQIESTGSIYLEVRESNAPARAFYKALGFQDISIRPAYYETTGEAAIVMKFHSC